MAHMAMRSLSGDATSTGLSGARGDPCATLTQGQPSPLPWRAGYARAVSSYARAIVRRCSPDTWMPSSYGPRPVRRLSLAVPPRAPMAARGSSWPMAWRVTWRISKPETRKPPGRYARAGGFRFLGWPSLPGGSRVRRRRAEYWGGTGGSGGQKVARRFPAWPRRN